MPDSTVLANFDPYDVACAVETYLRELDTRSIARVVARASQRLPSYYRTMIAEQLPEGAAAGTRLDAQSFERLIERSRDDGALRDALIGCLKSNLRVIPLIGGPFADNIIRIVRNEELPRQQSLRPRRAVLMWGALLVAVTAGAAGERFIESPIAHSFAPRPIARATPKSSPPARTALVRRPAAIAQTKLPSATAPVQAAPITAAPFVSAPAHHRWHHRPIPLPSRFAAGAGNGTVAVDVPRSAPPQTTQTQTEPNMTDMPDATNATSVPAPVISANPAAIPAGVRVVAPAPTLAPRKHGLLHRLNPFKPYRRTKPSPKP